MDTTANTLRLDSLFLLDARRRRRKFDGDAGASEDGNNSVIIRSKCRRERVTCKAKGGRERRNARV